MKMKACSATIRMWKTAQMEPATTFDMVGKHELIKPTLEVVYDAA